MNKGRKLIEDFSLDSEILVQCSFKTQPKVKHRLIQESKELGLTLSEHLSDIVTFYSDNESIRNQFNAKFIKFVKQISKGKNDLIDNYLETWNNL
jgi:predicted transposase YbfD/YdcC